MLPDRRGPRSELGMRCSHHRWWHTVRADRRPTVADTGRRSPIRDWVGSDPPSPGSQIPPVPDRDRADPHPDVPGSHPGCIGSTTTAPAKLPTHHQCPVDEPDRQPDAKQHSTYRNTLRSPVLRTQQWPTWRWHRPDPDSTPQPQTSPVIEADPATGERHAPTAPPSNAAPPEPSRHPLDQIRSPIGQEQLTPIRLHDPLTSRSQSSRRKTQKMTDPRLNLITRIIPLHDPQRTGGTETGQKLRISKEF
jgi:hypothetical protein